MTPQAAKEKLAQQGITALEFSKQNGLNYKTLLAVMNGTNKGRYGEAHRAAVALGMKQAA